MDGHTRSASSSSVGSSGGGAGPTPVACVLPPPATVVPVAAVIVSPTGSNSGVSFVASPVAAPVSPAPAAVVVRPRAPSLSPPAAAVPVQAMPLRMVPPTAAPIPSPPSAASSNASSSGSGGGLFGSLARLQSKMETVAARHAPGLVTAIREQVAAATMKEEQERVDKAKHAEKLMALANATEQPLSPAVAVAPPSVAAAAPSTDPIVASSSVAAASLVSPPSSTQAAAAFSSPAPSAATAPAHHVAHIPGLGPVALSVSPPHPDEQKAARDALVWSNLPKDKTATAATAAAHSRKPSQSLSGAGAPDATPVLGDSSSSALAENELRRRVKASPSSDADNAKSSAPPLPKSSSWGLSPAKASGSAGASSVSPAPPSSSAAASASAAAASAAAAAAASGNLKLDLPLRLCLVILKKSAAEMRERYAEYLKTKALRREGDEPLSFSQFMFFSTIRTLPDFLFKKTELAYCMMREEGDTLVFQENFVRYAPILAPLASKLDARALYLALQGATIAAGAALTHEQCFAEEMEAAEEANAVAAAAAEATAAAAAASESSDESSELLASGPARPVRRKAGGVGYVQFRLYVEALKKYSKRGGPDCGWPEVFTSFPEVGAAGPQEQLLLVRTGVTDTTTFPPHIGRMGITTTFLLYESSFFKRKRAIRWSQITRIERNDEGFWRKKAAAAVSAVPSSSSGGAAGSASDKARGINIYVQEDEVVGPGGSSSGGGGLGASVGGSGAAGADGKGRGGKRAEECLTWDQPGWGADAALERTRTFEYMCIMLSLTRLIATIPDKVVASALVQETCMSMLRMRALESVGPGTEPLLLNPFSDDNIVATRRAAAHATPLPLSVGPGATAAAAGLSAASSSSPDSGALPPIEPGSASQSFVASIAASISRAEGIRKSKSSWLFAVLPGLQDRDKEGMEEDIDPEFAAGRYKTAEELAVLARAVEQPFSLRNFAYNVKLLRHELEPLMLFIALVRRIRDWENPLLTLCTVIMLLNMAYRDLLAYLPAMLVLLNIAIVATLKYWPNALQVALGGKPDELDGQEHGGSGVSARKSGATVEDISDESIIGASERDANEIAAAASSSSSSSGRAAIPTAQPVSSSSSGASSSASRKEKDGSGSHAKSDDGLLAKLKNYRDVAVRTKEYLHSVQNSIGEQNVRFMKLEGLYKWRSPAVTQKFFAMLCLIFAVLVFVPFRFIFPVLVLDFFTTKWQHSSSFERLMEEVALPQRMPDVD